MNYNEIPFAEKWFSVSQGEHVGVPGCTDPRAPSPIQPSGNRTEILRVSWGPGTGCRESGEFGDCSIAGHGDPGDDGEADRVTGHPRTLHPLHFEGSR